MIIICYFLKCAIETTSCHLFFTLSSEQVNKVQQTRWHVLRKCVWFSLDFFTGRDCWRLPEQAMSWPNWGGLPKVSSELAFKIRTGKNYLSLRLPWIERLNLAEIRISKFWISEMKMASDITIRRWLFMQCLISLVEIMVALCWELSSSTNVVRYWLSTSCGDNDLVCWLFASVA